MTPAMLASADGRREGRAELARYRALLAERDALMRDGAARGHALLMAIPEGETRNLALRGEATTAARNQAVRDELSRSEAAACDAIQALFDWADANHAVLEVKNATLVVHGERPLAELDALEARLQETRRAADAAIEASTKVAHAAAAGIADARRLLDH